VPHHANPAPLGAQGSGFEESRGKVLLSFGLPASGNAAHSAASIKTRQHAAGALGNAAHSAESLRPTRQFFLDRGRQPAAGDRPCTRSCGRTIGILAPARQSEETAACCWRRHQRLFTPVCLSHLPSRAEHGRLRSQVTRLLGSDFRRHLTGVSARPRCQRALCVRVQCTNPVDWADAVRAGLTASGAVQ
jgi:hypothetical protein